MASSVRRVVKVEVAGRRGDYHVTTLLTWIEELKGFLERELGAELEVSFRELDVEYPLLYINGALAFEGLPGEEGYLIEVILSSVRYQDRLERGTSSDEVSAR